MEEIAEDDPEALSLPLSQHSNPTKVIYTIIHSPIYLVPILYITPSIPIFSANDVYTLLVPPLYAPSLSDKSIGVMGGLSATTHPETGNTCFWLHPCLTQEAMMGIGMKGEDEVRYLMGWMGIVGGGVGLNVPLEIGRRVLKSCPE